MNTKKIIVVDDHPMMLKGLVDTLNDALGFEVVGQFTDAESALQGIMALTPDLAVIDISLPGMSGMEMIKQLVSMEAIPKVLVVSRHEEIVYAERVLRAGAKGYVMKQEAGDTLIKAARKILKGGIYISEEVNEKLLLGMMQTGGSYMDTPLDLLSDRELEVFEMTGKGYTTREMAQKLHLSVKTVESYRARIKTKLNLENTTELMMHAVKWVESDNCYDG